MSLIDFDRIRQIEQDAIGWVTSASAAEGVGRRHHTVPRFYLARFADSSGTMHVRDRQGAGYVRRNPRDMAIKNFYTFVNNSGEADGRLEQALAMMESQAAVLIKYLLSPLGYLQPISLADSLSLAQFLAFQIVRGQRHRREYELMTNYLVKLQVSGQVDVQELRDVTVVPHPNEHLSTIGAAAEEIFKHLCGRPYSLVVLDKPLFITCDEPVLVHVEEGHVNHVEDCFLSQEEIAKRLRKKRGRKQIIHFYPTRSSGVARASEIALPVAPRKLILLGPVGAAHRGLLHLRDDEAEEFAEGVNRALLSQAFDWAAAHPDHPSFSSMEIPPVGPLVRICDGGSSLGGELNEAPNPLRPQRFRKDW
ncbi:DUF4238 domain-containing protein [Nonomuraea rhodomycinica]|uniref:DUF4238 domain-containing protein n=1 Tax=Nonomuraea rhodomycinica TaxID=1712872 RepID=A0A7Y6IUX1_9ACTN|nr:DUF4238 domain-containing protein [Nonomuraea rhodomycinica]NUW44861.1 DUF4238 domain-containing protein [Nonomuraea rhodomycinica]